METVLTKKHNRFSAVAKRKCFPDEHPFSFKVGENEVGLRAGINRASDLGREHPNPALTQRHSPTPPQVIEGGPRLEGEENFFPSKYLSKVCSVPGVDTKQRKGVCPPGAERWLGRGLFAGAVPERCEGRCRRKLTVGPAYF